VVGGTAIEEDKYREIGPEIRRDDDDDDDDEDKCRDCGRLVPRATKFERLRRDVSSFHICQSSVGRHRASCRRFVATVCMFVRNEMVSLGNCSARHTRLKSIFICSLSIRRQLAIDGQCVIGMLLGVTAVESSELRGESRIEVGRTDGRTD
jgi:hypothetical protein